MKRADFYKYVKENVNSSQKWWLRKAISNWTSVKFIDDIQELSNNLAKAYNQKIYDGIEENTQEIDKEKQKQLKKLKQYSILHKAPSSLFLIQNRRCDMRTYMLIASTKPKFVVLLSKQVQFRLSFQDFNSLEHQEISQITNFYIQKKYNKSKDKFDQYNPNFQRVYYQAQKSLDYKESQQKFRWHLLDQVRKVMRNVFETVRSRLQRKAGFFELFAFDFALEVKDNKTVNPILMDVISNPRIQFDLNFKLDTIQGERIVRALIPDALSIVINIHSGQHDTAAEKIAKNFQVVYQE